MTKSLDDFYNDLGARESGGNYKIINKWGYAGKYQMGEPAMVDAGYYRKPSGKYNNDWTGQFTGKDGVYSIKDFLNNPTAQENAQKAFKQAQWSQLKALGADKYIGKEINGVLVTQSGLLAAAHLKGPASVKEYLTSNGKTIPKDGLGTSVESYMKKFASYDVSGITGVQNINTAIPTTPTIAKTRPRVDKNGNHIFTPEEIGELSPVDFKKYLPIIEQQIKDGLVKPQYEEDVDFTGYSNPLSGDRKIYSREDLSSMSSDEFYASEKEIFAQMNSIGIPTNSQLQTASLHGGTVYVRPYTRSDGTNVRGYYRSA